MTQPSKRMEKAVAAKTTKRQTTPTLQERLSEIDWDLLEELDQQDEGQYLPMQDNQTPSEGRLILNYANPLDLAEDKESSPQPLPKGLLSK
ncbi:hypothetical protein A9199_13700 [Donghicola sp. JL3646]|nr:hypothetical protein BSK21_13410 [Marivivens sp. JLT3646]APO87926.1 hypothetical protein BSK21_13415 [Marivivens sp. JLT3646]OBR38656.1 hypothetical protein A9199_13700 [Donghicola sp. JL3646]